MIIPNILKNRNYLIILFSIFDTFFLLFPTNINFSKPKDLAISKHFFLFTNEASFLSKIPSWSFGKISNNFFETIKPKTLSPKNSNFSLLSTELKLLCVKLFIRISLFLKFIPIFFSNAETLLKNCKRYGIIQFAAVARLAFIANILLKGLTEISNIKKLEIDKFMNSKYDYASTDRKTYPLGFAVEIFSFKALEKSWKETTLPSEREHVTPYFFKNREIFRQNNFPYKENYSHIRCTVDTEFDFKLIQEIISKIGMTNWEDKQENTFHPVNLYEFTHLTEDEALKIVGTNWFEFMKNHF